MQSDIVSLGVELMLFGMGTVVVFLALLVVMTTMMSWSVARFFPDPVVPEATPRKAPVAAADDRQLVAAITAAIHQHRTRH